MKFRKIRSGVIRDFCLGLVLVSIDVALMSTLLGSGQATIQTRTAGWTIVAIAVMQLLAFGKRRQFPTTVVVALITLAAIVSVATTYRPLLLVLAVVLHWAERRFSLRQTLAVAVGFIPLNASWIMNERTLRSSAESEAVGVSFYVVLTIVHALLLGGAFTVGRIQLHHRLSVRSLEEQQQRAVDAERRAIRRELHDIVSNSIAVMTMAAAAASSAVDDKVRTYYLDSIQRSGSEADDELRRLLRAMGNGAVAGASEHLSDRSIDDLISTMEQAGLSVAVAETGDRQNLDQSLEMALYRFVQEGLTNCLKHGDVSSPVNLAFWWATAEVRVVVSNPIPRQGVVARFTRQSGFGLVGLEERIKILGGNVTCRTVEGRFCLSARLPITQRTTATTIELDPATPVVDRL